LLSAIGRFCTFTVRASTFSTSITDVFFVIFVSWQPSKRM
jgi:hypothetical protein